VDSELIDLTAAWLSHCSESFVSLIQNEIPLLAALIFGSKYCVMEPWVLTGLHAVPFYTARLWLKRYRVQMQMVMGNGK